MRDAIRHSIVRRHWTVALFIAVTVHAIWLLGVRPHPSRLTRRSVSMPRLSYLPLRVDRDPKAEGSEDINVLWSPVLFASSRFGFSKPLLSRSSGVRPPLDAPGDTARLLKRPVNGNPSEVVTLPDVQDMIKDHLARPLPAVQQAPAFALPEENGGPSAVQVFFYQGLSRMSLGEPGFQGIGSDVVKAWEVQAYLEFDQDGIAQSVLLERPTEEPELDAQIVRTLYTWRLQEPGQTTSGRVIIRCSGKPAPAGKP